jgi:gas vesicle protein
MQKYLLTLLLCFTLIPGIAYSEAQISAAPKKKQREEKHEISDEIKQELKAYREKMKFLKNEMRGLKDKLSPEAKELLEKRKNHRRPRKNRSDNYEEKDNEGREDRDREARGKGPKDLHRPGSEEGNEDDREMD